MACDSSGKKSRRRSLGALLLVLLAGPVLTARVSLAHLIPDRQGTLNLLGKSVFAVVSLPVSTLHGFDDDGDHLLSAAELRAHLDGIKAEVDRRFAIREGGLVGTTARVDLVLSPQHEAPQNAAEAVIALKHVTFPAPPARLELECDLFAPDGDNRTLTVTATRHPEGRAAETEVAIFTPQSHVHRFFDRPAAPSVDLGHASRAFVLGVLLLSTVLGSVWLVRRRHR